MLFSSLCTVCALGGYYSYRSQAVQSQMDFLTSLFPVDAPPPSFDFHSTPLFLHFTPHSPLLPRLFTFASMPLSLHLHPSSPTLTRLFPQTYTPLYLNFHAFSHASSPLLPHLFTFTSNLIHFYFHVSSPSLHNLFTFTSMQGWEFALSLKIALFKERP